MIVEGPSLVPRPWGGLLLILLLNHFTVHSATHLKRSMALAHLEHFTVLVLTSVTQYVCLGTRLGRTT